METLWTSLVVKCTVGNGLPLSLGRAMVGPQACSVALHWITRRVGNRTTWPQLVVCCMPLLHHRGPRYISIQNDSTMPSNVVVPETSSMSSVSITEELGEEAPRFELLKKLAAACDGTSHLPPLTATSSCVPPNPSNAPVGRCWIETKRGS